MATPSATLCVLFALTAAMALPASAQTQPEIPAAPGLPNLSSSWVPGTGRSYLGLNLGRSIQHIPCSGITLLCDDSARATSLHAGTMIGRFWGMELGLLDSGRVPGASNLAGAQGLNLSLVGKAPLSRAIGVYGKLGTTVGRPDTSVLGGAPSPALERGYGLSYSAGVSVAFTPRLSATLGFESNDFRFAGSLGDPVRSTNLGLQYRY